MNPYPFEPFESIRRLSQNCVVTEKIDGTNAQVFIPDDCSTVYAGSRNRWITPEDDNYGFAAWVQEHKQELLALGPGRHFGEWWGRGIQRNYGLKERKFSLFNSGRWISERPACCDVVPILYAGAYSPEEINKVMASLEPSSVASPGFGNPEGIVIYMTNSKMLFKKTFDDRHKGSKQ